MGSGDDHHPLHQRRTTVYLYARPQAPRLLRQHQPQQGTPRTPRPASASTKTNATTPSGTTGQRGRQPGSRRPPCPPYPNRHGRSRQPPRWNASVPSNGSSSRSVQNWNIACAMPTGCPATPCRTTWKPFANGMNYGIQSLFCATCHTMEAMERYASAHIAGEELMRRGAQ